MMITSFNFIDKKVRAKERDREQRTQFLCAEKHFVDKT